MNFKKLFFVAVIVLSGNASFAQDIVQIDEVSASHSVTINIPDVALLALKSSTSEDISLAGTAPTVAGKAMTFGPAATNNDLWLNYSSIPKGGVAKNVTVNITYGTVPTGLKLSVEAIASTTGGGKEVNVLGVIDLKELTETPLISEIKSAFTGTGSAQGHNLIYNLGYATSESANYADLNDVVASTLTITYTLSEI